MLEGNVPINELFASARNLIDDILKREGGTGPDRRLMLNFRLSSVGMWPKLSGMLPTKLFDERPRKIREERFPNDEGICPERPFSIKLRYFTGEERVVICGIEPMKMFFWRQIVVRDKLLNITSGSLPVSLLLISRSTWRDELLPKESGISPVRLLPPRSTCIRDELPPKDGGMFPDRLLPAKIKASSFGSIPKPTGMLPCNLLLLRFISRIFMHWLSVCGISPCKELFHRPRTPSWAHDESSDGISPLREFMLRLMYLRLIRRPRSDGMAPWKPLSDNCSLVREVRLAMQGDIGPARPSDMRSSAVTRLGDCAVQVTPCQLQNCVDVLLHDDKALRWSESCDLKQRRACRSFSLSVSLLLANAKAHTSMRKQGCRK